MSKNRHCVWAGVLCALALIGQQAARADDVKPDEAKAATLAHTSKVGDTVKYKSVVVLEFSGNEVTVEQTRKHTVKEIKDNKDVVVLIEGEGGKLIVSGAENELPGGSEITVTQDKANKILSFKPKTEDNPYLSTSTQHLLALVDNIILPDKPVKPGDSWTTEIDNPQVKGKKVTIKTTYVKTEKAGDAEVWKVKQTVEADTEVVDTKLKAEITATLDAASGQLIEAEHDVKGIPGTMGVVDWKGTLKRVKPEAAKAEKSS